MGDTPSRRLERTLTIGTWALTLVHVIWFYVYTRSEAGAGASMMSFGDWWGFCKTWPGAATALLAMACSIAQTVVILRSPAARRGGGDDQAGGSAS